MALSKPFSLLTGSGQRMLFIIRYTHVILNRVYLTTSARAIPMNNSRQCQSEECYRWVPAVYGLCTLLQHNVATCVLNAFEYGLQQLVMWPTPLQISNSKKLSESHRAFHPNSGHAKKPNISCYHKPQPKAHESRQIYSKLTNIHSGQPQFQNLDHKIKKSPVLKPHSDRNLKRFFVSRKKSSFHTQSCALIPLQPSKPVQAEEFAEENAQAKSDQCITTEDASESTSCCPGRVTASNTNVTILDTSTSRPISESLQEDRSFGNDGRSFCSSGCPSELESERSTTDDKGVVALPDCPNETEPEKDIGCVHKTRSVSKIPSDSLPKLLVLNESQDPGNQAGKTDISNRFQLIGKTVHSIDCRHGEKTKTSAKLSLAHFQQSLMLSQILTNIEGTSVPTENKTECSSEDSGTSKQTGDSEVVRAVSNLLSAPTIHYHLPLLMMQDDSQTQFREDERRRFASFYTCNVPQGVWVTRLASAGFYLADRQRSIVRCADCGVELPLDSLRNRDPTDLHSRTPPCPRLATAAEASLSVRRYGESAARTLIEAMLASAPDRPAEPGSCASDGSRETNASSPPRSGSEARATPQARAQSCTPAGARTTTQASASSLDLQTSAQRSVTGLPPPPPPPPPPSPTQPSRSGDAERAQGVVFQTARPISELPQQGMPSTANQNERSRESASTSGGTETREAVTYRDLGIYTQQPKRPDLVITQVRVNTFTHWPHVSTHPSEAMAEAGFYYTELQDLVRCFYCKGGLKSWEGTLEPWVAHARYYPQCPFVGQVKGQEFVAVVQELAQLQNTVSAEEVQEELRRRQSQHRGQGTHGPADDDANAENAEGAASGTLDDPADEDRDTEQLSSAADELEAQNRELGNEDLCKICQSSRVQILFLPCGHLCACAQCSPALRTCAVCRRQVAGRVRVTDAPAPDQ